ncbi:MAG TPA: alpha/beta hydrolase [Acidimicrobiales bacterium]|nr:alpha/beta hydrolase [Acidimicrobiales bacterium]
MSSEEPDGAAPPDGDGRRQPFVADIGGGYPVLLLHGQPGDGDDWSPVIGFLRQRAESLRLIAPDRPGYGRTGGRATGPLGNADFAADLLRDRRVGAAVVVGHSFGAAVALALAERHPELVSGLVLVAPAGNRAALGAVDRLLAVPGVGEAVAFAGVRATGRVGQGMSGPLRHLLGPLTGAAGVPAERAAGYSAWLGQPVWQAFAVEQRGLLAETEAIEDGLGTVTVPATVITGASDRIVPPAAARRLAEALPGGRLLTVARAGHLLIWRRPAEVADAVADMVELVSG